MTGRQEYDRTKDRQRILDKYMVNTVKWGNVVTFFEENLIFLRIL
jgi:hypothetical protein